jgi:putative FmdB family regulatory protein
MRRLLTSGVQGHSLPVASRPPIVASWEDSVATYDYGCGDCGCFEQRLPMGTAMATVACPSCGRDAKRIFAVPMSYRTSKPVARMLAREEASRDDPQVVERVPPRRRPRRPTSPNPALARLPRP